MTRKEEMLSAGVKLAKLFGVNNVTRRMVAQEVGVTDPLVAHYLGDVPTMRKAIAKEAKARNLVLPTGGEAQRMGIKLRSAARRGLTYQEL